jgi:hypothetical protein
MVALTIWKIFGVNIPYNSDGIPAIPFDLLHHGQCLCFVEA